MNHGNPGKATIVCATAVILGVFGLGSVKADDHPVGFGLLAPMTGTNAVQGRDMDRGARLAVQRINEGYEVTLNDGNTRTIGPGLLDRPLRVSTEDSGARPSEGMDAIRRLISAVGVDAVLGTYSSGVTVPTGQYANENGVVMMGTVTTSPQLREIGPYFFSGMGLDHIAAAALAEFAVKDSGATRFGSLTMNNPFGVGMEIQACKALEEDFGGSCVNKVRYEDGRSDYRSELRRAVGSDAEAVFYTAFGTDSRQILRQAMERGIEPPKGWYASYMSMWSNELAELPEAAEGIKGFDVGVGGEFYDENYAAGYEETYGESPRTAFGGYTYDGVMLVALAIQKAGTTDSDAVRDAIPEVAAEYRGVTGDKTMDEDGMQVDESYAWKIFTDGEMQDYPYPD